MSKNIECGQAVSILEVLPVAVVMLDAQDRVLWLNIKAADLFSQDSDALVGQTANVLSEPFSKLIGATSTLQRAVSSPDGLKWYFSQSLPLQATESISAYMISDVSEQQNLSADLERLCIRDAKTGLLNSQGIHQMLEAQVSRSRRYGNPMSVVRMDIVNVDDKDQQVSSSDILKAAGHLLNDQLRWADVIGRVDDNAFIFLLPETVGDDAPRLVEKISGQLDSLFLDNGRQPASLKACFGITAWQPGDDPKKLLGRASCAVNHARENDMAMKVL